MTTVADYRSSKELFLNLTLRELRSKYKRSFFGWLWSMATPLIQTLIYSFVFVVIFSINPAPGEPSGLHVYSILLLCKMLPFLFVQNSVMGSIGSLVGNENLIKKTYFPRELLPGAATASTLVAHLIEMGVLMVVVLAFGNYRALFFTPLILVLMLVNAAFALGLGLLLSVLNVYFRDVNYFMTLFFLMWEFLTPIMYPLSRLRSKSPTAALLMKVNPMTDQALSFQNMFYDGKFPSWLEFGYFVAFAVFILGVGLYVFNRLQWRIPEEI